MVVQIREYRSALPSLATAGAVLFFAALTAAGSRVLVELPGIPAPLTLQVLAVLLAGLSLGWRRAAASQLAYVTAIASGIPIDARMHGTAALLGPSGGYLLGFVLAAAATGALAERSRSVVRLGSASLVGLAAIYACGSAWLAAYTGSDAATVLRLAVAPFIGVDLLKAVAAVMIVRTAAAHTPRTGRG